MRGLGELQQLIEMTGGKADPIFYFIPHEEQNLAESSPLQGFTPDVLEAATMYARVASLPRCVHELLSNNEFQLAYRIGGDPYRVFPVEVADLQVAFDMFDPYFCCILSPNDDIAEAVEKFIQTHPAPVLHASGLETSSGVRPDQLGREIIRDYVVRVLAYRESLEPGGELVKTLREAVLENEDFKPITTPLPYYNHLVALPNEIALQAAGFTFKGEEESPLAGLDNEPYFEALRQLVGLMRVSRGLILKEMPFVRQVSPYDLVLTSPSILKRWRATLGKLRRDLPAEKRRNIRFALRQLIGRPTYSIVGEASEAEQAFGDEHVQALLAMNKQDLDAYTAALSIRASSHFVPVLRLPTSVNNVRGELVQLEKTARAEGPTPRRAGKLSRLARQLSAKLVEGLPEWVLEHVRTSAGIKLISDAPLEWMSVDGFPLALRADVSRIPTTPGNMFFHQTVVAPTLSLSLQDFDEILIIRAFRKNDPIRHVLTEAVETYRTAFPEGKPAVKYVDVESEQEFLRALENFSGALAVFDGHGGHSSEDDVGALHLADARISAWELRQRVRLPPIVVLSACDTSPLGASHVTTANGFLAAGARTVVGTSLPVNANLSAQFIARLLLRIGRFIPALFKSSDAPVRWSKVVSGLQKRQYMTDVIFAIAGSLGLQPDEKLLVKISVEVGTRIDSDRKDWLEALVETIAQAASKPGEQVRNFIETDAYLTDALLHVQLGNPEHISISRD